MTKIKHSKYKNTGLIFEILVHQIASDTISDKDSKAIDIIKKYFTGKTELAKEHKLYQILINSKTKVINESKAESLINSAIDLSKKLNKKNLRRDKYNLVKEIKDNYDIDSFFKTKIKSYKEYASIFNLLELYNTNEFTDPNQIIENKCTLLEYITKKDINEQIVKDNLLEEYIREDKGTRLQIYRILVEKFNTKYQDLNETQKLIIKEYINNITDVSKLKLFIDNHFIKIKREIRELLIRVTDPTIKIKLNEILNLAKPLDKKGIVKESDISDLLQYYEIINELKKIHK